MSTSPSTAVSQPDTASSWTEFARRWGGTRNFLLGGEVAGGFGYEPPPAERIIDEVRAEPNAHVRSGVKGDAFDLTDIGAEFRRLPLQDAMRSRFVLAYFRLHPVFTAPGRVFEGLEERWVAPWREALRRHGFSFHSVYPILFASGPHSASNYHMDSTHQLAWQCHGTKHFHGLNDPDRWTTPDRRALCELTGSVKPAEVGPGDAYTIVQPPGSVLWNAVSTPHWVETFDGCAVTLTLVHVGLRHHGRLCPHAEANRRWLAEHRPAHPMLEALNASGGGEPPNY